MDMRQTDQMSRIKEKWHEFREWQRRPHQVAPMSEEQHRCATCGTEFQGNYCPRCGQAARIGRYSFRKAFLLFLDVWGLGNRGMFRTLRDLILRPGYMIRDYLSGMQMAYFPPFKLFFLLTTLSLLVESGVNIKMQNYFEESREEIRQGFSESFEDAEASQAPAEVQQVNEKSREYGLLFMDFVQRFPNIYTLSMLFILSGFLYIFFRKSPNIPDLRFSELLVAQVYTADMYSIYSIVMEFLCLPWWIQIFTVWFPLIPLKQLSGFPWWKIILFILPVVFVLLTICLAAFILGFVAVAMAS